MPKVYKIRNKLTGLFSAGGVNPPHWVSGGKIFSSVGTLKSHMAQFRKYRRFYDSFYAESEIVEYEVTISQVLDYEDLLEREKL